MATCAPVHRTRWSLRRGPLRVGALVLATVMFGCGADASDEADAPPENPLADLVIPPGTDVWIAALTWEDGGLPTVERPRNVTRRVGYDNQPHFLPDGSGFWYTAIDESIGQADIWRYDLEGERVDRVTASSPESEYSATPLPDGSGISVIRVEADSTQRLWRFDHDGANAAVVVEHLAPVGYHAWADDNTLVTFVLGDPPTLQRVRLGAEGSETIARDIGRSIQPIPGTGDISFVQRNEDGGTTIMRLPPGGELPTAIIDGVDGGDFHAWAPDGTLLMASGGVIHAYVQGVTDGWVPVGDFSGLRIAITRLAVSPDGTRLALVAEPDF